MMAYCTITGAVQLAAHTVLFLWGYLRPNNMPVSVSHTNESFTYTSSFSLSFPLLPPLPSLPPPSSPPPPLPFSQISLLPSTLPWHSCKPCPHWSWNCHKTISSHAARYVSLKCTINRELPTCWEAGYNTILDPHSYPYCGKLLREKFRSVVIHKMFSLYNLAASFSGSCFNTSTHWSGLYTFLMWSVSCLVYSCTVGAHVPSWSTRDTSVTQPNVLYLTVCIYSIIVCMICGDILFNNVM